MSTKAGAMAQADGLSAKKLSWSTEPLGERPVMSTRDIRQVGLSEGLDELAIRFYYSKTERVFRIPEPNDAAVEQLKQVLEFISSLKLGDPIEFPEDNELDSWGYGGFDDIKNVILNDDKVKVGSRDVVTKIWKIWRSIYYLVEFIHSSIFLTLTPATRPLIQLSIEVQDVLYGRKNGSILSARSAARVIGVVNKLLINDPNRVGITPFQTLFRSLSHSASKVDTPNNALWLRACCHSVEAAITFLKTCLCPSSALEPLQHRNCSPG